VAADRLARRLARLRSPNKNEPARADQAIGAKKRAKLLAKRAFANLHRPYGPLAAKLKIGHKHPPSAGPPPEPEPPPHDGATAAEPAPFEPNF
jgi:hypothetical protein